MKEPLLEVKDLRIIYKTSEEIVHAVNGISFSIEKQETLGLVGETGAGKTTTALSILQLLPDRIGRVEAGSITYAGEDLLSKPASAMQRIRGERIAMIFQDPMTSLNPVITVGDQIREALELHNESGRTKEELDRRVDEMLELVSISPVRRNEYPHQFSGGMKQRVVIAMALACDPDLLIADEPTTALDVTIQAQVLAMIAELKQKLQTSMLLITHDLGVVAQTCDQVAVMYAGEIVECGTVEDIFEGTRHHPYTKGLFDSIPDLDRESDRLQPIAGLMPDPTDLPCGCKFHPRCPHCIPICAEQMPPLWEHHGHRITCHLFSKEAQRGGEA